MRTLYEASNAVEAHMLLDLLKQQGLAPAIEGEHLHGAMGGLHAYGQVRLVIDEAEHARARARIDQWEAEQPANAAPARPRVRYRGLLGFAVGLFVGVGGTWAAYRTQYSTEGIDYNRDGLLDEKWTYSPNGAPLKVELDRNLDRKVDAVLEYEHGLLASGRTDDDFDGVFETKQWYGNGNLENSETDTDGDGYPDMRSHFSNGVLDRVELVNPATGLALRVEHYRLGKLVQAEVDTDKDGKLDTRLVYDALGDVKAREPLPK